jgi:phosphoadenosine phosphosulfate reductase
MLTAMPASAEVIKIVPPSAARNGKADSDLVQVANWPPTPEWLAEQSARLEAASPSEIIAWAVEHFYPKLTMATAFGPEGCLIIHWLAAIEPRTPVFNLDTGYQFKETLELRDRMARWS